MSVKDYVRFSTAMILLTLVQLPAQQRPRRVHINVIHDGHGMPTPAEITVGFAGHSLRIAVRGGEFEIPLELLGAKDVTVEIDVDDSHIRVTKLAGTDFSGRWTLRLAEHADDDYYDWPGPKEANIATSCMLELDNGHEDPARIRFEQGCRSQKKK